MRANKGVDRDVLVIRGLLGTWRALYVVVVPLIVWRVSGALMGILALIFCAGFKAWRKFLIARAEDDAIAAVGSRTLWREMRTYRLSWFRVAHEAGLSMEEVQYPSELLHWWRLAMTTRVPFPYILDGYVDRVPAIVAQRVVPLGYEFTIEPLAGQTLSDYEKQCQRFAHLWRVSDVRARAGEPGFIVLTLVTCDPLAEPLVRDQVPAVDSLDVIEVGQTEEDEPWRLPLTSSTVIGGVPGSGKSVLMNLIIESVIDHPHVSCVGGDLKGGIEFHHYRSRMTDLFTSQTEAIKVLEKLEAEHKKRMEYLVDNGYKSMREVGYSQEWPLLVLVVDECAELFVAESTAKDDRDRVASIMRMTSLLARQGRATGISLILSTQKPTADSLPTVIRDSCENKIAFRCATSEQARAVLGDLASSSGVSPCEIPMTQRGVAIASSTDGGLQRVRSYQIVDKSGDDLRLLT